MQCIDGGEIDIKQEEVIERIAELGEKLYLHTDFDIWELLFRFMDERIAML